jgi:hypothetical protein
MVCKKKVRVERKTREHERATFEFSARLETSKLRVEGFELIYGAKSDVAVRKDTKTGTKRVEFYTRDIRRGDNIAWLLLTSPIAFICYSFHFLPISST